ncbi:hypothetical protein CNR22_10905 [Sphingobacteriaceae bacterium]|nr:hypothetical protein CNR22_10905 [Sphingobacteriaceae bacterium]
MYRILILTIFFASFANAQTKKPVAKTTKPVATKDTVKPVAIDTAALRLAEAAAIPKEFAVYTKRSKIKGERNKLCINLVSNGTVFNHCINDSLTKDPEVSKILFEKKQGDSTYVLVYVRAFSKPFDKPACDAGKEVKLFFVRWNTATNKAVVRIKTVESCMKAITDMSTESVDDWDKSSPIVWKYHKGAQNFVELKFDPQNYLQGFQSTGDTAN